MIILCPAWDGNNVCNSRAWYLYDRDAIRCTSGHIVSGLEIYRSVQHPYKKAPLPGL